MKLLDLTVLGITGGLVYLTWKRQTGSTTQPIPAVKKLLKKATAKQRGQSADDRSRERDNRQNILNDTSDGRRIGTMNSDGSTSHHVVGRGVRHA